MVDRMERGVGGRRGVELTVKAISITGPLLLTLTRNNPNSSMDK